MPKRNDRKKNIRKPRRSGKAPRRTNPTQPTVRVSIRGPVADSVIADLFYQDDQEIRQNVPGTTGSWRYRMNSAYDPDPVLGTGAVTGFTEWAAMYTRYRIVAFSYDIMVANLELFPQLIIVAPSIPDIGANYSRITQMSEVPYGKKSLVSAMGGQDKCLLRDRVDLAKMLGSKTLLWSDNYSSAVTTNPNSQLYFNIGFSSGGATTTKGLFVSARLQYRILFYARANITL